MLYNNDSFVYGYNQDTPENILARPSFGRFWLSSPHIEYLYQGNGMQVDYEGYSDASISGKGYDTSAYQRPALIM